MVSAILQDIDFYILAISIFIPLTIFIAILKSLNKKNKRNKRNKKEVEKMGR